MNNRINYLSTDSYLISDLLHNSLNDESLHKYQSERKFHVLMIRVLNNNEKSLVYNFISYPYIFISTYIYFMSVRANYIFNTAIEPNTLLTLYDNDICNIDVKYDNLGLSKKRLDLKDAMCDINSLILKSNKEIFDFISCLFFIGDINLIANLIDYALKRDYYRFAVNILNTFTKRDSLLRYINDEAVSIINTCVCVVGDKNKLIELLRDEKGYNINGGPQSERARVNSINYSLSLLDSQYRNSLYNHHNYHIYDKDSIPSTSKMNKKKFSFKNIHMNLNNVR